MVAPLWPIFLAMAHLWTLTPAVLAAVRVLCTGRDVSLLALLAYVAVAGVIRWALVPLVFAPETALSDTLLMGCYMAHVLAIRRGVAVWAAIATLAATAAVGASQNVDMRCYGFQFLGGSWAVWGALEWYTSRGVTHTARALGMVSGVFSVVQVTHIRIVSVWGITTKLFAIIAIIALGHGVVCALKRRMSHG